MAEFTLIDTHCHLDFPVFDKDRLLILEKCQKKNINTIIVPGVCSKDWVQLLCLCQQHKILHSALGLHPCFVHEHQSKDLHALAQFCNTESIVAIGEIGLDYYSKQNKMEPQKKQQRYFFGEQLQIAKQYQLPVLIHARKSHEEVIQSLKALSSLRGIIHAYSGSYEQAKEYLKLGFKLGFGGAFTYPKARKLRLLIPKVPLDAWVLETDAPDMAPAAYQGERNSPLYLAEIVQEFISLFKLHNAQLSSERIVEKLLQNSRDVFSTISL